MTEQDLLTAQRTAQARGLADLDRLRVLTWRAEVDYPTARLWAAAIGAINFFQPVRVADLLVGLEAVMTGITHQLWVGCEGTPVIYVTVDPVTVMMQDLDLESLRPKLRALGEAAGCDESDDGYPGPCNSWQWRFWWD